MADTVSSETRSRNMAAVKSKGTTPEMRVRRLIHGLGYRYRLHRRDLPGNPDIVFGPRHKVIFVHGCFWHRHRCRKGRSMPTSNVNFWRKKLEGNKRRDANIRRKLRRVGWSVLVIWECETKRDDWLESKIIEFLENDRAP